MIYLVHHGIKGQKWGVSNGPPYPLADNQHSAKEEKAGWRKSISNKGQIDISTQKKKSIN